MLDRYKTHRGACKKDECSGVDACPEYIVPAAQIDSCSFCGHLPRDHVASEILDLTITTRNDLQPQIEVSTTERSPHDKNEFLEMSIEDGFVDILPATDPTKNSVVIASSEISIELPTISNNESYDGSVSTKAQDESLFVSFIPKEFSDTVKPLLDGKLTCHKKITKLRNQFVKEIITFLDSNSLIESAHSGVMKKQYRKLNDQLMAKYPSFVWSNDKKDVSKLTRYSHILNGFTKKLSSQRRQRKYVAKKNIVERIISKEEALETLQNMLVENFSSVNTVNLLHLSYELRKPLEIEDKLPFYLLYKEPIEPEEPHKGGPCIWLYKSRLKIFHPVSACFQEIVGEFSLTEAVMIGYGSYYIYNMKFPTVYMQYLGLIEMMMKGKNAFAKHHHTMKLKSLLADLRCL